MRKTNLAAFAIFVVFSSSVIAQETTITKPGTVTSPYAGILLGGCGVSNPVSFLAGIQQAKHTHFSIVYDIYYWNTRYRDYSDNVYSKGHFSSFTPSVKFIYSTG